MSFVILRHDNLVTWKQLVSGAGTSKTVLQEKEMFGQRVVFESVSKAVLVLFRKTLLNVRAALSPCAWWFDTDCMATTRMTKSRPYGMSP
jgi:hypothetical protein